MQNVFLRLLDIPLAWSIFLFTPFEGFTFTDALDFVPLGLIATTLVGLIWRHRHLPSPLWTKGAFAAAIAFAVLTPLVPLYFLNSLAARAAILIGHWPQVWVNDPKWIGPHDAEYQQLSAQFIYASAFAGWGLIAFAALRVHLCRDLSRRQARALSAAFALAWLPYAFGPGDLLAWWLD